MTDICDVAVIGGGFGGTLVAMCLADQGRDVVVIERETHPRFATGESSTPLANWVLRDLANRYG
ncbi:MAG: FAD-dependent oxidoreductase, partial [Gemmatimonadales bacterium]|nr:FAD-dependent oxidoreductase [Gemmatimonadales bacterium]